MSPPLVAFGPSCCEILAMGLRQVFKFHARLISPTAKNLGRPISAGHYSGLAEVLPWVNRRLLVPLRLRKSASWDKKVLKFAVTNFLSHSWWAKCFALNRKRSSENGATQQGWHLKQSEIALGCRLGWIRRHTLYDCLLDVISLLSHSPLLMLPETGQWISLHSIRWALGSFLRSTFNKTVEAACVNTSGR